MPATSRSTSNTCALARASRSSGISVQAPAPRTTVWRVEARPSSRRAFSTSALTAFRRSRTVAAIPRPPLCPLRAPVIHSQSRDAHPLPRILVKKALPTTDCSRPIFLQRASLPLRCIVPRMNYLAGSHGARLTASLPGDIPKLAFAPSIIRPCRASSAIPSSLPSSPLGDPRTQVAPNDRPPQRFDTPLWASLARHTSPLNGPLGVLSVRATAALRPTCNSHLALKGDRASLRQASHDAPSGPSRVCAQHAL